MTRSIYSILALGIGACVAISRELGDVVHVVINRVGLMLTDCLDWLIGPLRRLAQPLASQVRQRPAVALVQARAYVDRWLHRDVPRVEATWRLVPST